MIIFLLCTCWLCFLLTLCPSVLAVPLGEHSNCRACTRSANFASSSTTGERADRDHAEMASTALDFREMMRKERELAMKKRGADTSATVGRRYLSNRRRTRLDLKRNHRVAPEEGVGLDGIYYIPGFVTEEEGRLLENAARGSDGSGVAECPEWKDLYKRRLQIHGGTPHPSGMVEEDLPPFLRQVCDALVETGIFPEHSPPNHVLLNEYSEGQGIGPHKDGPLYEGRVAILSLGKEAFLDFWGSLEDAKADCAAIAATAAESNADATNVVNRDDAYVVEHLDGGSRFVSEEDKGSSNSSRTTNNGGEFHQAREGQRQKGARSRALVSVRCEDCSLVVFEGKAYYDAWHGIASTTQNSSSGGSNRGASSAVRSGKIIPTPPHTQPPVAAPSLPLVRPSHCEAGGPEGGDDGEVPEARKRLSFTIRRVARVIPGDSVMEHPEARSEMERRRRGFEQSVTETGVVANGAHT